MKNNSQVSVVGSIAYDDLVTSEGSKNDLLGGSAIYFSIAACNMSKVSIIGSVGEDFKKKDLELLESKQINIKHINHSKGTTFRWKGSYVNNSEEPETLITSLGVFKDFSPCLNEDIKKSQYVFLNIARISNFASYFSLGVLRNLGPKLTREMGILPRSFGNLILLMGLVQMATFSWLGSARSTQFHYRISPLIVVQLFAITGFLGMWMFQNASFWIPSFCAVGLCAAITYFSSLYYSLHNQQERGDKSGWHEAILGVGVLLGPFIGGGLDDLGKNHQNPYLLCAVVIGLCVFAEIIIWGRSRRINDER